MLEMTEAFTAGVMIFIEQFQARWPWSGGILDLNNADTELLYNT